MLQIVPLDIREKKPAHLTLILPAPFVRTCVSFGDIPGYDRIISGLIAHQGGFRMTLSLNFIRVAANLPTSIFNEIYAYFKIRYTFTFIT